MAQFEYKNNTDNQTWSHCKKIFNEIISKICTYEQKKSPFFDKKLLARIDSSPELIEKICKDRCVQEIVNGDDVLVQIVTDGTLKKICQSEEIFSKLSNYNFIDGIRNNEDLITQICDNDTIIKIFGSRYNSRSRTDKFYGFFGKLIAAYKINKATREWDKVDRPKLKKLRDKHKGERGFVICNGPSLNKVDFNKLKNEITIGSNGLYMNSDMTGFLPSYYVIEDDLIGEDRKDDLNKIDGTLKLFAQRLAYCLYRSDDVIYLKHTPDFFPWKNERNRMAMDMRFSPDISIATYGGNTVTFTCLQVAFYLGLKEVYIVGADHNYSVPDRYSEKDADDNYIIESQENDSNHFNKDYFGNGFRWHNPKVHKLENAYINAKKFYDFKRRKIFNATIGGHLEVYERVNFSELFESNYRAPVFSEALALFRAGDYETSLKIAHGLHQMRPDFRWYRELIKDCEKRL
ncbi:6-hydroxymethylpterin diphosphokinase MptE-like protein [Thermodesulfobacteriota bacterium]